MLLIAVQEYIKRIPHLNCVSGVVVHCMGFEPEKCDDGCFEVMERYYTSEDAVYAFTRTDRMTFKAEFGDSFYYECVRYSSEWVEVDETTIPKWMINSSVFCDWEV